MNWKLTQLGTNPTIAFAADELNKYLKRMDRGARVTRIVTDQYDDANENALYIGLDPAFDALVP